MEGFLEKEGIVQKRELKNLKNKLIRSECDKQILAKKNPRAMHNKERRQGIERSKKKKKDGRRDRI